MIYLSIFLQYHEPERCLMGDEGGGRQEDQEGNGGRTQRGRSPGNDRFCRTFRTSDHMSDR